MMIRDDNSVGFSGFSAGNGIGMELVLSYF